MRDRVEYPLSITSIGQDSHPFMAADDPDYSGRPLILGGLVLEEGPPLKGNSDADVVLHALTNAISGLNGYRVLGGPADQMCQRGIRDSGAYVRLALASLEGIRLTHLSFSIEAKRPHLAAYIDRMREAVARLVRLPLERVAITATTGEGLTAFGRGEGMACTCVASALLFRGGPLSDEA